MRLRIRFLCQKTISLSISLIRSFVMRGCLTQASSILLEGLDGDEVMKESWDGIKMTTGGMEEI